MPSVKICCSKLMAHETTVRKEFTSFLAKRDHSQHLLSEPVFLSKGSLKKIATVATVRHSLNYLLPELGRGWPSRPACGPWPRTACRTSWESRAASCSAPPHWSWRGWPGPGCGRPSESCLGTKCQAPSRNYQLSSSEFHFCMLNFAPFMELTSDECHRFNSRWWTTSWDPTVNDWKEEIINSCICCWKYSSNSLECIWLLLWLYSKFKV